MKVLDDIRTPEEIKMSNDIKNAMNLLTQVIKNDRQYAIAWHCNLSSAVMNSGVKPKKAHEVATLIMKKFFDAEDYL